PLKCNEGYHVLAEGADLVGTAQLREIDHKRTAHHFSARTFEQFDRGEAGAAGGDQIVDQQNVVALVHRVGVNFHAIHSVFERIVLAQHLPGQLAFLAYRNESDRQLVRNSTTEYEPARLDTGHLVDTHAGVRLYEFVDRPAERARMAEQCCDVAEDDPGLR